MKKILILCLVMGIGFSGEEILSELKKENLKLKEDSVNRSSDLLENSWINPLTLSISKQRSQITSKLGKQDIANAQLSFNQDIFRSGGIFYAIKYADATRLLGLSQVKSEKNAQIIGAYSLLIQILKNDKLQAQQKLSLKNSVLDIKRKKEQYLAGLVDISFLNDAITAKIAKENALLQLQDAKDTLLSEFEKLSDKEYDSIKTPKLKTPKKEEFIAQNLALLVQKNSIKSKKQYAKMTKAKYLPRIFINANYTISDTKTRQIDTNDNYYGYGIGASMPLDIKMNDDIEQSRLEYLIAQNELAILKESQTKEYEKIIKDLKRLDEKIALARKNIEIYDSLLSQTKELVTAGMQIQDDQIIMENSKNIRVLEAQIYELEKEIKKLEFYKNLKLS